MTTFRVMHEGQELGTSGLENHDPSMGIVHGRFRPSPAYERVREVFRLFAKATERTPEDKALIEAYYRQRDALNLSLLTGDGTVVGTSVIHIYDHSQTLPEEGYELEVGLQDAATYDLHFSP